MNQQQLCEMMKHHPTVKQWHFFTDFDLDAILENDPFDKKQPQTKCDDKIEQIENSNDEKYFILPMNDYQNHNESSEKYVASKQPKQKMYSAIFRKQKSVKKNSNVAKYFMKNFILKYGYYQNKRISSSELRKEVAQFMKKERFCYLKQLNWNTNLSAMKKIFGLNIQSYDPYERSARLRESANTIISEKLIPQIKKNRQIQEHTLHNYLITLKVQLSRCRNVQLMCRTEVK